MTGGVGSKQNEVRGLHRFRYPLQIIFRPARNSGPNFSDSRLCTSSGFSVVFRFSIAI